MTLKVNGKPRDFADGLTVVQLLDNLGMSRPKGVAVEVNREIVPRSSHTETVLQDGDEVNIYQAVGGG